MAETKRGGFHALEKKIHEIEEKDRKAGREPEEKARRARDEERRESEARRPPPAHDE